VEHVLTHIATLLASISQQYNQVSFACDLGNRFGLLNNPNFPNLTELDTYIYLLVLALNAFVILATMKHLQSICK